MGEKPKVLLVATLDSKEVETRFIRERLEENGLEVYLLDASIRRTIDGGAHITPDEIAAAVGTTMPEIRALNHEGKCMAIMMEGSIARAHELDERVGLSGIIAAGGSGGTTLGCGGHADVPLRPTEGHDVDDGVRHDQAVRRHQGHRDAEHRVRRGGSQHRHAAGIPQRGSRVGRHGAWLRGFRDLGQALGGHVDPQHHGQVLQQDPGRAGADRDVRSWSFHSQGTGGQAMDEARPGPGRVPRRGPVIDRGGRLSRPGPLRRRPRPVQGRARRRVSPPSSCPGNIDFLVDGPIEGARARFPGRMYHIHNASVTAVRADAEDFKRVAEHMAGLIKDAKGSGGLLRPAPWLLLARQRAGPSARPVAAAGLRGASPEGHARRCSHHGPAFSYQRRDFADAIIEQAIAFQGGSLDM